MWRRHIPKPKKHAWFVPVHWSYLPASWQGWSLYVPYIVFLVFSLVMVDRYSPSVLSTFLGVIPYWVSAAVVMHWIAAHKS